MKTGAQRPKGSGEPGTQRPLQGAVASGDWGLKKGALSALLLLLSENVIFNRSVATQGVWGTRDPVLSSGGCRLRRLGVKKRSASALLLLQSENVIFNRSVATQGVWGIRDPAPPSGGCRLWRLGVNKKRSAVSAPFAAIRK